MIQKQDHKGRYPVVQKSHPNSTLQPHPTNKIVIDSHGTCADRYNHATTPETCKLHATSHSCHYSKEVTCY